MGIVGADEALRPHDADAPARRAAGRSESRPLSRLGGSRAGALAAAIALVGCARPVDPAHFQGGGPEMRPERFFLGETRSTGVLEAPSGGPLRRFQVEGHGSPLPDGGVRLQQTVRMEGQAPTTRTWELRAKGSHGYGGSLTDASGAVAGEAYGELFHLRYPLRGVPFGRMEQWLYLQPDGRTVVNIAVASVAGVPVRRLSERISRVP